MTLDGTAITTTATLSTGISDGNLPVFTSGVADDDFLRVAGTSIEGRSASEVLSDIGGQASLTFGISNTNAVKIDSASVADDEYARFTASGLESRSTAEVLSDIGASPVAGSGSIVTTGALDAGSITSGFGSIDNGSSAITTTGVITGGTVEATTDTAAGDNAAIGYTSAEGLILTGQGSTSDVTIKNDADATVLSIPTGTTNVGIGTTAAATKLHIVDSLSGGQLLVANSESDNAVKYGTFGTQHYDTDQEPVLAISAESAASENNVLIGGALGEFNAATSIKFYTAANATTTTGTERMRIDSSGNVGIGTTSPTGKLTVSSDIDVLGSNFANVEFTGASVNGSGVYTGLDSAGGYVVNVRDSGLIGFSTSNAERMRIRANGQVLINQTSIIASDNAYLQVTGGSVTPVALRGGTNNYFMAFYKQSNNDLIGSITGSTGTGTSFNETSDYRLKENVNYFWDATTRLKQLKPARFNFIADPDNTIDGFIAHEVQEVVPHAITGEKDAVDSNNVPVYQQIDKGKLIPLLVKTIQELEARITALEAG
jgi:hypothetical protein